MMAAMAAIENLERDYSLNTYEGWQARVAMPKMDRPDQLSLADVGALSRRDRLMYNEVRAVWHANIGPIVTPEMRWVIDGLENLVDANRQHGDKVRSAAVLDAYAGLGKTTLATRFGADFYRNQIDLYGPTTPGGHERVPVAYVTLSSATTMRSLNAMLCRFYQHPGAERGNAGVLAARAAECGRNLGTKLIIIDDVHFLNVRNTNGRDIVNHFKWLQTEFHVTFLFVGVGIDEQGLMREGRGIDAARAAQTARRWTRFTLGPFTIRDIAGRKVWRKLLLTIEGELVLANSTPGMLADDLANYLFARSTGHFASLMTLIIRGCNRAIKSGEERITAELLDGIANDVASEEARQKIESAMEHGRLTAALNA